MMPPFVFNLVDSFMRALLFVFVFGFAAHLYRMAKAAVIGG
jgi:hypothetical protein